MFEALIEFQPEVGHAEAQGFTDSTRASPGEEVDARFNTAKFLEDMGVSDAPVDEDGRARAREAFGRMLAGASTEDQKQALARLDTPASVKQLVGMLTAYDWNFVEQAAELRGYTLAGIMNETKHPDAKVRLKALELMGKVTEIALFTERLEVKQVGMSDEELEKQLREKLEKFIGAGSAVPVAEVQQLTAEPPTNQGENNESEASSRGSLQKP